MTPAETIQAAIDKLIRLRDESVPGPWRWEEPSDESFPHGDESLIGKDDAPVLVGWGYDASGINSEPADRDLIVTLHATIDAQIAILQRSLDWFTEEAMSYIGPEDIALARAILGEQVDA